MVATGFYGARPLQKESSPRLGDDGPQHIGELLPQVLARYGLNAEGLGEASPARVGLPRVAFEGMWAELHDFVV
ncbi:MAG: hypothetical protein QM775_01165 [Pirellulales bacterium]